MAKKAKVHKPRKVKYSTYEGSPPKPITKEYLSLCDDCKHCPVLDQYDFKKNIEHTHKTTYGEPATWTVFHLLCKKTMKALFPWKDVDGNLFVDMAECSAFEPQTKKK